MALEVPLPEDVSAAIGFAERTSAEPLKISRKSQLTDLADLAHRPLCSSEERYAHRPHVLRAALSGIQVGLVAQLGSFTGLGAQGWLGNYVLASLLHGQSISRRLSRPQKTRESRIRFRGSRCLIRRVADSLTLFGRVGYD